MKHSPAFRISMFFLLVAAALLFAADLEISSPDPWGELGRMLQGLLLPRVDHAGELAMALAQTVAFAFVGVGLGVLAGFPLALAFHWRLVRWGCALARSVHELFWALLFLQALGLNAVTGVLAIAVPYAGTLAKVYAEILEEADPRPARALPHGTSRVSVFLFARLPILWRHLAGYSSYRLECGLRSSAVLGFIGLPTLGFHLESYFSQGLYHEAGAALLLFYVLIAGLRFWVRPRLIPLYLVGALAVLWTPVNLHMDNLVRFLTVDLVPAPLRASNGAEPMTPWLSEMGGQALAGLWPTLVLGLVAMVGAGLFALVAFPMVSRHFTSRAARITGHVVLVVLRSTPEYMLAYLFLQMWGPSMLPAIVALALHNGAILAHLTGRHADTLTLPPQASRGLNRYGYEVLPRVYGQFLAFLFYRWEVILRETAILGMLGIRTLGFFVDNALEELRLDRAVLLVLFTGLVMVAVDALSRRIRQNLRLDATPRESALDPERPALAAD